MLANLLVRLINFYEILIIVWCILSWVPRNSGGVVDDISEALGHVVRPYLDLFRRFIPPMGGLDFSPVVAIIVLGIVQRAIVYIL